MKSEKDGQKRREQCLFRRGARISAHRLWPGFSDRQIRGWTEPAERRVLKAPSDAGGAAAVEGVEVSKRVRLRRVPRFDDR